MNSKIEDLYLEIGQATLSIAEGLAGKLLIYAEVEDGVISADLFYIHQNGNVRFKFCPASVKALVYSLWENWKKLPGSREWRVMCYVIDAGKFSIDLTYPDQVKQDEDTSDRRPRAVAHYFNGMKVDYSTP